MAESRKSKSWQQREPWKLILIPQLIKEAQLIKTVREVLEPDRQFIGEAKSRPDVSDIAGKEQEIEAVAFKALWRRTAT